jgi:hypothetical protein
MVFSSNVLPSWPQRPLSESIESVAKKAIFGQILTINRIEAVFTEIQLGIDEADYGFEEYSVMARLNARSALLQLLLQIADAFIRGSAYLSIVREKLPTNDLVYATQELDRLELFLIRNRALLGRESHRLIEHRLLLAKQSLNRRLNSGAINDGKDAATTVTAFPSLLSTFAAGFINASRVSQN